MRTKDKMVFTDKCMAIVPKAFITALFACILFLVAAGLFLPSEGGKTVADCEVCLRRSGIMYWKTVRKYRSGSDYIRKKETAGNYSKGGRREISCQYVP